jgi:hypothetical protein
MKFLLTMFALLLCTALVAAPPTPQSVYQISGRCMYWDPDLDGDAPIPYTAVKVCVVGPDSTGRILTKFYDCETDAEGYYVFQWYDRPNVKHSAGLSVMAPQTVVYDFHEDAETLEGSAMADMPAGIYEAVAPTGFWWYSGN